MKALDPMGIVFYKTQTVYVLFLLDCPTIVYTAFKVNVPMSTHPAASRLFLLNSRSALHKREARCDSETQR